MNLIATLIATLSLLSFNSKAASVFSSPEERESWKSRARADIERRRLAADDEAIRELSDYVIRLNTRMKEPETDDIRILATEALISIPNHAKYYEEKLEAARDLVKKDPASGYAEYRPAQREIISSLYYVPSHSTVEVMGRLLNDPEDRDKKPLVDGAVVRSDYSSSIPCYLASNVMKNMGIENPPKVQDSPDGLAQVDAWKDWWNEVKAGKRTYRFIGSPIEYGPDGPVEAKEISRREHDRSSGSNRSSNGALNQVADASNARSSLWSKIAAGGAVLLLLMGAWFAFGRRKALS